MTVAQQLAELWKAAEAIGGRPSIESVCAFARSLGLKFRNDVARKTLRPFVLAANAGRAPGDAGRVRADAIKEEGGDGRTGADSGRAFAREKEVLLVTNPPTGCETRVHAREENSEPEPVSVPAPTQANRESIPGLRFAEWFYQGAISSGVLPEQVDPAAWAWRNASEASDLLRKRGGEAECKDRAAALFRVLASGQLNNRAALNVAFLNRAWDWRVVVAEVNAFKGIRSDDQAAYDRIRAVTSGVA